MPLAVLVTHDAARPSPCALSALRTSVCSATMTTPGVASTTPAPVCSKATRTRRTGFSHRVGAPTLATLRDSGPSLCPGPMLQGVSYVQISGIGAYIRTQMPIRAPAGLPCTIEAIIRSGTDTPSSRPTGPFSPNVGEEKFCELRLLGILRSSLPASHAQVTPKIAHLSDTPVPIRKYARHVTDKGTP